MAPARRSNHLRLCTPRGARTAGAEAGPRPESQRSARSSEERQRARQALEVLDATPAMIWRAGADGERTFFSRAWLEFTGRELTEELGWGWLEGVHPEDRERCRHAYDRGDHGFSDRDLDFRLQRYDGEYRWLAERSSPFFSSTGDLLGFAGACTDVTPRKLLAARLEAASEQLSTLVEALPEAVILKDGVGRWQLANSAARALLGIGPEEWRGRSDVELSALFPALRSAFAALATGDDEAWARDARHDAVELLPDRDGMARYVEVSRVPIRAKDHKRAGMVLLGRNATERRLAEDSLRLAASVFEHNPQGIMITDAEPRILRVNRAFSEITGYAALEVLGRSPNVLNSGHHDSRYYAAMWESLARDGRWAGEIWNRRRNGEIYPEWLNIVAVTNERNEVVRYVGTFSDIAERKGIEAELRRLTYSDALTGLGNARFFEESLAAALAHARAASARLAVLLVDLGHFGDVNELLGPPEGDSVIRAVSARLVEAAGRAGIVARWHGKAFAVLLQEPAGGAADADRVAARIASALAEPLVAAGTEVHLTVAQGVSVYPQDGESPAELLRCAASALREAQRRGPGATAFFDPSADALARERHRLEGELRRALSKGELCLRYQPQLDGATGALVGAEALLRWQHERRGLVRAAEFVPLAEETELIVALGEFALETACRQLGEWRRAGQPIGRVSVNVAARQLRQRGFLASVRSALAANSLAPSALGIEITETVLVDRNEEVIRNLRALREMGVEIAVDDFGTGYSSLSYLKRLPIDVIKLDRSFVSGLPDDAGDVAISRAICALARALGLRVIAEGVETPEQARALRECGAVALQGYHVSPALSAVELVEFVRSHAEASEPHAEAW